MILMDLTILGKHVLNQKRVWMVFIINHLSAINEERRKKSDKQEGHRERTRRREGWREDGQRAVVPTAVTADATVSPCLLAQSGTYRLLRRKVSSRRTPVQGPTY